MRAISGLWRWRHNPLRRGTDLAEAWVALASLLLVLVAAPLTGCLAGGAAQSALQRSVRAQHQARHLVPVTVGRVLGPSPADTDPEVTSGRDARSRVLAHWTGPDGTGWSGPLASRLKDPRPGDRFRIWTDGHGRPVARPLDTAAARAHAVLAGFGAALAAAALIEGGRRLVVWRMLRRRYAHGDRAWDKAGPDWGRTGTGS